MPAAELMRLRQQINQLILVFHDAALFCQRTRELLELYAQLNYRAGQAVQPQPLLPSYRVPPLVMRQLTLELGKTCQETPQQAIAIVSLLWKEPYLEPRQLSASLLGIIPVQAASDGVIQCLREWAHAQENMRMIAILMEQGTVSLRREMPDRLLGLIEEWMAHPNPAQQAIGVQALISLVNDRAFENLPAVYRLISPGIQSIHPRLQTDLQLAIQALIKRSPTETAFFLRQALSLASGTGTARLVRRCLPAFDAAQQASLRAALQSHNPS